MRVAYLSRLSRDDERILKVRIVREDDFCAGIERLTAELIWEI